MMQPARRAIAEVADDIGRVSDGFVATLERIRGRPPFDSPWVRDKVEKLALPGWFGLLSLPLILGLVRRPETLFFDARLYIDATRVWLAGGDPWSTSYLGIAYAAPPPSLLPLIPFALFPRPFDWVLLGLICVAGTVITIRMLSLPWWWLLFPPVVQGVTSGNVQMLLIPLILGGGGWLATLLKAYALVPVVILGQWRQVAVIAVVLVVSYPLLPWPSYFEQYSFLAERLASQTGYGLPVAASALLIPVVLPALVIIGRPRAAWLAVPALWPSQQWYYATLTLPVRSALVGAVVAVPLEGSGALATILLAAAELYRARRAGRVTAHARAIARRADHYRASAAGRRVPSGDASTHRDL